MAIRLSRTFIPRKLHQLSGIVPLGAFLLIGATATVRHFANGVWFFLVDWGLAIGARAQRLTGYACIAFGVLLLVVGVNAMISFIRPGGLPGGFCAK